jgi:hypothetical protein
MLTPEQKQRIVESVQRWRPEPGVTLRAGDLHEMAAHAVGDAGINHEAEGYRATEVYAVVIRAVQQFGYAYDPEPGAPRLTDFDQDELLRRYAEALGRGDIRRLEAVIGEMYARGDAETEARLSLYHKETRRLLEAAEGELRARGSWARGNV